jgi:glycosyltransferase involved in cell wall biosynthesis
MSPANKSYLQEQNPEIPLNKIEICPNCIELIDTQPSKKNTSIREKFGIPIGGETIFIYGGNLGKPQGLDFLLEILKSNNHKSDRFFIIAGSGTEYSKMEQAFKTCRFSNAVLLPNLPKNEYDQLVQTCDVGLIFLDPRFTIPNYPSRLLSYLEYKMPIIVATDLVSDVGQIAEENHYGFFVPNGDLEQFNQHLEKFILNKSLISTMGENGYKFLMENYTVDKSYQIIMSHFTKND